MRPSLVIALLVAAMLPTRALGWQTTVTTTPPAARPSAVTVDPSGDVIAVGRTVNASGGEDAFMVKLDGTSGNELWQHATDGSAADADVLRAVAADANAIVAAGQIVNTGTTQDALVVKRNPAGGLVWQIAYDGGSMLRDDALAVALDASGNALVGLQATPIGFSSPRFTVLKRKSTDGTSLWVSEATGQAGEGGVARALVVDGGVVYAGGDVGNLITVTRLDGQTGAPSWRTDVAGNADAEDVGRALAVGGGRVVVAGRMMAGGHPDFAVIALDATTGNEVWRHTVDGSATDADDQDDAFGVAVDAAGNVLAAGRISDVSNDGDLIAVKLAGATGAELWRTVVDGPNHNADVAQAMALAPNGDLLVTGTLRRPGTRADFLVARFANATGAELWRTLINGSESEGDQGLAIAAIDDDVIAGGRLRNGTTGDGFVVTRRSGSNGGEFPCGNGESDPGEACDDANGTAGDGCRLDCTVERCGDGIRDPQDGCDDGNTTNGDCCSDTCGLETGPCDDDNACTLDDACVEGVCTPASSIVCTPETPCHTATCVPDTGECVNTPKGEGALCDDGNACTSLDRCFASVCNGTSLTSCSDTDPCTVDGCDPTTGCSFTPLTSLPSVICLFERDRIADACGSDVPRPIEHRIALARRLVGKANDSNRDRVVRRSLTRAAKALDKARRLTEKQRRRDRIGTGCADVLDAELADMASRTRAVGSQIAP